MQRSSRILKSNKHDGLLPKLFLSLFLFDSATAELVYNQQVNHISARDHELSKMDSLGERPIYIPKYIDEQGPLFPQRPWDELTDVRLSNLNHLIRISVPATDFYKFDLGPEQGIDLEQMVINDNRVNDDLCEIELSSMLGLVSELETEVAKKRSSHDLSKPLGDSLMRLAHLLDSFGRYEAGVFAGRDRFLGSYPQCIDSQLILNASNPNQLTDVRYCVAKLRADKHLNPALSSIPKSSYTSDNVMMTAICIPSSCHTRSFSKHKHLFKKLVNSQFKLPKSIFVDENLALDSIFCLLDSGGFLERIPFSGKIFLLALSLWLIMMFYATFSRNRINNWPISWKQRIIKNFDILSSWQEFKPDVPRDLANKGRVNLNTLNVIKVLGCTFVVYMHGMMFNFLTSINPLKAYYDMENDPTMYSLINGSLMVDTFFVISGILITYLTMKKMPTMLANSSTFMSYLKQCLMLISFRYLRFVPIHVLVFWFKKSVLLNIGSGPSWDAGYNIKTLAGSCRLESWWSPFLSMAAYLPLSRQCHPQMWSVANDMISSIILVPIILLLGQAPSLAIFLTLVVSLASNHSMYTACLQMNPYILALFENLRFQSLSWMQIEFSMVYTDPKYRVFTILIGAIGGYALYHYDRNDKLKHWPNWFKRSVNWVALPFLILVMIAPAVLHLIYSRQGLVDLSGQTSLKLVTTGRLPWAASVTVVLLRMVTDWQDNFILRACSGQVWKSMARLNYCILLTHIDVILFIVQTETSTRFFSKFQVWNIFCSTYLTTCLVSIFLHVFFENPINKIIGLSWSLAIPATRRKIKSKD